jgi:oligoribonuclease
MGLYVGAKALLWVDLETTGDHKQKDDIIEIGAILTDFEFEEQSFFQVIVLPDQEAFDRMMAKDIVREMHTENGLIKVLEKKLGYSVQAAQAQMVDWLGSSGYASGRLMLAGSGVSHFDRAFIDRDLPLIASRLTYPPLDIGVVRRFLRMIGAMPPRMDTTDMKTHRALDDIRLHLEEARTYKKFILGHLEEIGCG